MRFGVCTAPDNLLILERAGYDYIELSVAGHLKPEQPEAEVMPGLIPLIDDSRLKAETYNVLLPGDIKVVGDSIDVQRQTDYLHVAFRRAASIGGKVLVFGSAGSRSIPDGCAPLTARRQVEEFLALAGGIAEANGLCIAIEPLNTRECNHINSVSEAFEIAEAVGLPTVGVLADLYHITAEGQSLEETARAASRLLHVHVAGASDRRAPNTDDVPFLIPFFRILKSIGYAGRVSVEGNWTDLESQASETLDTLRSAWDAA